MTISSICEEHADVDVQEAFGFLAVATTIALLPAVVRADEADTALALVRQDKVVTIGYRESAMTRYTSYSFAPANS